MGCAPHDVSIAAYAKTVNLSLREINSLFKRMIQSRDEKTGCSPSLIFNIYSEIK